MTVRNSLQALCRVTPFGRANLRRAVHGFNRDENGGATIMTLIFFLVMIAAGGIAIDMMRYEMKRAQIQATLDSAVLASAGAPYGSDHRAIIEDYFRVANMSDYLAAEKELDIQVTVNSASVTANADMTMDTYLMRLSGIKTLQNKGASTAVRKVPKLEVVLVLDVSGSMGNNSKLVNLKKAAKEFVTSLLQGSEPGNTVISIVPFSWSVSPSEHMFSALAVDRKQDYSTCIRFKENDHSHASLATGNSGFSSGQPLDQMVYTALYGTFDNFSTSSYRSCYADDYMEILPFSVSETALHAKIESLKASGNTSGNQGMIWGAALLDPSFRQITDDLITAGEVASTQAAIPANYGTAETLKVAVVMGDGQNTTSYFFSTGGHWRGANSDLRGPDRGPRL
ncbi:pilus assembly protein TadG-related protein [Roseovarius sp. C7]|uniref:pilus assembly protein TadG-related protein n=1 Tax=Roseovarius sp. C7 TaxID=3398643 RepID=UPI0039F4FABB